MAHRETGRLRLLLPLAYKSKMRYAEGANAFLQLQPTVCLAFSVWRHQIVGPANSVFEGVTASKGFWICGITGLVKSALKKNDGMNKIDSSQPTTNQIKDPIGETVEEGDHSCRLCSTTF